MAFQLLREIQRITSKDDLREMTREHWKVLAHKVVKQARLEADHNKRIAKTLNEVPSDDDLDGKT